MGSPREGPLDVEAMRRSLGVGAFVCGYLDMPSAAELAGVPLAALADHLDRLGVDGSPRVDGDAPLVSVVVPVLNEEANVAALVARLAAVLGPLGPYELIFVDDGSTDTTVEVLAMLHAEDAQVKVVELSRNFGHQNALSAGIDRARGRAVVLMDGDGQDPPELLPEFVARWEAGADVVYGVRARRQESWPKRVSYRVFYRVLARFAEMPIHLDAGDFCLMDARVVDVLRALPESGQFLRGLRSWAGFRQEGVRYDRPARQAGETAYNLRRLVRLAVDGLLSFSSLPLRLATWMGFLVSMVGLLYLAVGVAYRLFVGRVPAGWTSIVAVVVLLGGAQLTVIGVMGEYLSRVYAEAKRRPRYVVRSTRWGP